MKSDSEISDAIRKRREQSDKRRAEELQLLEKEREAQSAMLKKRKQELEAQLLAEAKEAEAKRA